MTVHLSTLSSTGAEGTPTGNGAQYASIITWEAAAQGFHQAGDQTILECYKGTTVAGNWQADGGLNELVRVGDWANLSASQTLTIRAAAGHEHGGVSKAGFFLESADTYESAILHMDVGFWRIRDIETISTSPERRSGILTDNNGDDVVIERCICDNSLGSSGSAAALRFDASGPITLRNCLSIGTRALQVDGRDTVTVDFSNNTIIGDTYHSTSSVGTAPFKNNVFYGSVPATFSTWPGTNNAFSSTGAFGTNQVVIDSTAFVDYAGGNYNPAPSGPLDGAGTDLSGDFTEDIAGNTRSVPWEIGAYEIAAAALTFSLSPDSGPLPAGLSVNPTTGNIEGTPTESGTFPNIIVRGSE